MLRCHVLHENMSHLAMFVMELACICFCSWCSLVKFFQWSRTTLSLKILLIDNININY